MSYYFTKTISGNSLDEVIAQVTEGLKTEGFGILTEIDVAATFKKKLDIDFRNYRILGACNPNFAHKAISAEPHIGVFLPCNVVVQEIKTGEFQISAVDPIASMVSVENDELGAIAGEVQSKLRRVIDNL